MLIPQIGNACGSIGLLHSLLNLPSSGPHSLTESSPLASFKSSTLPLTGLERAKRLDQADFFSKAHEAASKAGQSSVPETEEEKDVDLHFISFVKAEGSDGYVRTRSHGTRTFLAKITLPAMCIGNPISLN